MKSYDEIYKKKEGGREGMKTKIQSEVFDAEKILKTFVELVEYSEFDPFPVCLHGDSIRYDLSKDEMQYEVIDPEGNIKSKGKIIRRKTK